MKVLATLLVGTLFTLLGSWILFLYWGWFVVPVFGHPISYRQTVGLSMTIGLELVGVVVAIQCKEEDVVVTYFMFGCTLAYCLVVGFLWHLFL